MERASFLSDLETAFSSARIVALLGPRQCGKTTLARTYFSKQNGRAAQYFDLENPLDLARLHDPLLALQDFEGLIIIDEIQRQPNLFPILRVLVDRTEKKQHYLILGSASRELIRQSSESLAGRIHYMEVTPFSYEEVKEIDRLWVRGGFPLSYLAEAEQGSARWRQDYIRTFLEQDIPNLGIQIAPAKLRRFWMMLAHYHGQLFNASELANAMDISHVTAQHYLDILSGTFMVRQLLPWHENISKRQVKSKKIYFRDSGILHSLLGITEKDTLQCHPKLGASWEGFALECVIRHLKADQHDCYFWATHAQAKLDLLVIRGGKRIGFEFKHTLTPRLSRSMQIAKQDLHLDKLIVIYPGEITISLSNEILCFGLESFLKSSLSL